MKSHTLLSSMHSPSPQANQESGHSEGVGEVVSVRETLTIVFLRLNKPSVQCIIYKASVTNSEKFPESESFSFIIVR